jgi:hypothetical protein
LVLLIGYYSGDHITADEMDRTRNTQAGRKFMQDFGGNTEGKRPIERRSG